MSPDNEDLRQGVEQIPGYEVGDAYHGGDHWWINLDEVSND